MGEAMLYGQTGGSGGGGSINGVVESYKIFAGGNISAGDFVKFIKNEETVSVLATKEDIYKSSEDSYTSKILKTIKIDDDTVLIFHRDVETKYILVYSVLKIIGSNVEILHKAVKIAEIYNSNNYAVSCDAHLLDDGRIIFTYANRSGYPEIQLCRILEDYSLHNITTKLANDLSSSSYYQHKITKIRDRDFFFSCGSSSTKTGRFSTFRVLDNDIEVCSSYSGSSRDCVAYSVMIVNKGAEDNIFILSLGTSSITYRIFSVTREDLDLTSIKSQTTLYTLGFTLPSTDTNGFKVQKLSNGKFLAFFPCTSALALGYGILDISDYSNITLENIQQLDDDYSAEELKIHKVDDNKYLYFSNGVSGYLRCSFIEDVNGDGTTLTLTDKVELNGSNSVPATVEFLDDGKLIFVFSGGTDYRTRVSYILATMNVENKTISKVLETKSIETYVMKADETTFDGVAETGGKVGDYIDIQTTEEKSEKNCITNKYKVNKGEIKSGDFVKFVDTIDRNKYTSEVMEIDTKRKFNYTSKGIKSIKLDDGRILIIHTNTISKYYLTYSIVTIKEDGTFILHSNGQLDDGLYSGYFTKILPLNQKNHFLLIYSPDNPNTGDIYVLSAKVIEVKDNEVEILNSTILYNKNYSTPKDVNVFCISENRFAVFHDEDGSNNPYLYCTIFTLDNSFNFTVESSTLLLNQSLCADRFSVVRISDSKFFISYQHSSSRKLGGMIVTIDGTNVTNNYNNAILSGDYTGRYNVSKLLPNGNILTIHSVGKGSDYGTSGQMYATVTMINEDNTFTMLNSKCISNGEYDGYGKCIINKLENGYYGIIQARDYKYFNHVSLKVTDDNSIKIIGSYKSLYENTPDIKYLEEDFDCLVEGNRIIVFMDGNNNDKLSFIILESSSDGLSTSLSGFGKEVIKAHGKPYDGIAEESGAKGDEILITEPLQSSTTIHTNHNLIECVSTRDYISDGDFVNIERIEHRPTIGKSLEFDTMHYADMNTHKMIKMHNGEWYVSTVIGNGDVKIYRFQIDKNEETKGVTNTKATTIHVYDTTSFYYLDSTVLKDEYIFIFYDSASDEGDYPFCSLSKMDADGNITKIIAHQEVAQFYATEHKVFPLSDNKVLCFFRDVTYSSGKFVIITLNDDETLTIGNVISFDDSYEMSFVDIGNSKIFISYRNNSNYATESRILTINPDDTITFGEKLIVNNEVCIGTSSVLYESNKILCTFFVNGDKSLYGRYLEFNDTTITASSGKILIYNGLADVTSNSLDKLLTQRIEGNLFACSFTRRSPSSSSYSYVGDMLLIEADGTTINVGNELLYAGDKSQCGYCYVEKLKEHELILTFVKSTYVIVKTVGYNGTTLTKEILGEGVIVNSVTKATELPFDGIVKTGGDVGEQIFVYTIK